MDTTNTIIWLIGFLIARIIAILLRTYSTTDYLKYDFIFMKKIINFAKS